MSEVNAVDLRPISSVEDVFDQYTGAGHDMKTGVEVELAFFDPESPDLTPMTVPQNKVVKNATNAEYGSDYARNEPSSEMLEIGSIAGNTTELKTILNDTQDKIKTLTQKAADIGLKRSYFQHLPEKSAGQLLQGIMDVERYQAFFGPPREDMKAVAAYFTVCKSNQISVSYRDHDHLLENIRRIYALAPFFYMIFDNQAPFNEGQPFKGHAGIYHRASLGGRGGIPPYVFTAQSGEEYIQNHIDHVMNNPLFVYYDETGKLIRLPSGTWTSFNALREQGLNTATNYYFSQSILWPDVKIAALKDDSGEVYGHRYEARMIGVGLHQHQTALLVISALAFDAGFADKVDRLLKTYGFDVRMPQFLKTPIEKAYKAAQNHNGQFLNIPYGNGTMANFAKAFADILESAALIAEFEEEISPLISICRTGCTDSKVNAFLFDTLDKAINFQRHYDSQVFDNPNQSTRDILEKDIKASPKYAQSCIVT